MLASPLLGVQSPRVLTHPPSSRTLGVEAADFYDAVNPVGDRLFPWQRLACEVVFGLRPDGKWAAFETGLLVARQNGKGGVLEAVELAKLFLFEDRLIMHSAHEFKTAQEAFLRIKAIVDGSDELRRQVARVRTSHGEEGIELTSGARLRFVARSRSSGKGFSADTVIMDEAQELKQAAIGALMPTLSARPNAQILYTGTVPGPDDNSEHWESVRDRGRSGKDPGLAWLEWSPGERLEDLADREAWAAANPSAGQPGSSLGEENIAREFNAMDDASFARERLSLWGALSVQQVIDPDVWSALVDAKSSPHRLVCFAADITPDRQRATIAVAGERADGRAHLEVVQNERGTGWLVPRLVELQAKWPSVGIVVDPGSPAGSLIPMLQAQRVEPILTSARDVGQACGSFYDLATTDGLRHLDDPRLNVAVGAARKRPLGDSGAWAWHRKDSSTDITPLVAATLAWWGFASRRPASAGGLTRVSGRVRSH